MLIVRLLGPVEAVTEDVIADLGGPQQRAVLAHLALEAGKVVSVERLIDRIWGDDPPRTPLGTLQSYVSRLRRAIEPARAGGTVPTVLVSEAPGYVLRVDPDHVDVHRFRALVEAARSAATARDHLAAVGDLDAALALWRGPALAGIGPEHLVRPMQVRLEEERAAAIEDRFEAMLALGRHKELIPPLQSAVDDDPLRERRWALLARALYRDGRQAEALRALARAREILAEELGLEPGPELRDVEARILAQDPGLMHTAEPAPVVTTAAARGPAAPLSSVAGADALGATGPGAAAGATVGLVEREAEWSALTAALDAANRGPALVLVEGEPGIGKSTLCDAFLAHAGRAGWRTAIGRCVEPGLAPTLWPFIEVARSLMDHDEKATTGEVANPWLRLAFGRETSLSAVELADHFVGLLDDDAPHGCVILLDDLHWADQPTLDLLHLVLTRLGTRHVLVVAAFRPPDLVPDSPLGPALGRLHRAVANTARVALAPLDAQGVAQLIEVTTGVAPSLAVAARVQARAGGNPLFVTELARLAGERGLADDSVVPEAIRDVVRSRLAALPDHAIAELEVAAVLGERVDVRTVMAASDRDADACLDALDAAIVTRILVPEPGGYRFAHALVRDAVVGSIPALRRARLHHRAAEALLASQGDVADVAEPVAHHRLASASFADPVVVANALVRASDVARWRNAFGMAEWLADQALTVLDSAPHSTEGARAEVNALEALVGIGVRTADRAFEARLTETVRARADRTDAPGPKALSLFMDLGPIDELPDLREPGLCSIIEQARLLSERTVEDYSLLVSEYIVGAYSFLVGDCAAATDHLDVALEATRTPDPDTAPAQVPVVLLPLLSGLAYALTGRVKDARDSAHRRSRAWLAQRAEVDPSVTSALAFSSALVEAVLGNAPRVRDEVQRAANATHRYGFIAAQEAALTLLGAWAAARLGDRTAVTTALDALAEIDTSRELTARSALRTIAAETCLLAGDERASDLLRRARAEAEARSERWWLAETIRLQAHADALFDGGARVGELLDEAERLAEQQGAELLLPRIRASRAALT